MPAAVLARRLRLLMVYEIVVKGRVQGTLSRALDGFEVVATGPWGTRFRGCVDDQGALHAALGRIAGCNLILTSVRRVDQPVGESPERV
jgi:hypothetical protein